MLLRVPLLLGAVAVTVEAFSSSPRNVRVESKLFHQLGRHHEQEFANPIVGRRELLGISAAMGALLWKAADASASSSDSWMAATDEVKLEALDELQRQAYAATKLVIPEIRETYERDGVVLVRGVISDKWLELLREACIEAQDEAGPYAEYLEKPTDEGIFFTDLELARRLPSFSAFSKYSPASAVAGAVMGSNSVSYLYDQLFVKEKGVSTHTPWHQDGGYWRVAGPNVCSVFVPMDPVEPSAGLSFVKGSNKWGLHNPQHFADGTQYSGTKLPKMPDIDKLVESKKAELVMFDLQPGDVLVFSSRTVHGGPGNWGRALSTRWAGDGSKFWARPGEGAIPTGDVGLADGELLAHSAAFPTVWTA